MLLELVDESQKYVLNRVRLKHLYIETTVLKDFAQNLIFWKINCQARVQVQGLSQISNKRPGPGACSYNCNVTHPPTRKLF